MEYDAQGKACGVRPNNKIHCNRMERHVFRCKSRDPSVLKEPDDLQYGLVLKEKHLESDENLYIGLGQGTFLGTEKKYKKMGFEQKDQLYHRLISAMNKRGRFESILIDASDDLLGSINWGCDGIRSNCLIDIHNRLWIDSNVVRGEELFCDYRRQLEYDRFSQASRATYSPLTFQRICNFK